MVKVPAQLLLRCRRSTLHSAVSGRLFVFDAASHRLTKLSPSRFIVRSLAHIARALCGPANGVRSVTGLCFGIHASLAVAFVAIRLECNDQRGNHAHDADLSEDRLWRMKRIMNRNIQLNQRSSTPQTKGTISMNKRKTLLAIAIAASSLGVSLATYAANVVVDVDVAPPASSTKTRQRV
jgi:hypothetical protein